MSDTWTIVWKEWRETIIPGGRLVAIGPLFFIIVLGVIFPLINREGWLTLPSAMVLLNIFFPYYYILLYIGDAFAGERERHTLATLLASRITDRAILWGKVIATVTYIWGMVVISSLLSVVVVNLALGQRPMMFFTPVSSWLAILIFSLLACLLAASIGILVSLHTATVRQAQQTMAIGSLVLFLVIYFAIRAVLSKFLLGTSSSLIFLIAMLVVALLDTILLTIAMGSFRRSRLILS